MTGRGIAESGQYQQAMNQFDQVIALDVTETRIKYPVLLPNIKAGTENMPKAISTPSHQCSNDLAEEAKSYAAGQRDQALAVAHLCACSVVERSTG